MSVDLPVASEDAEVAASKNDIAVAGRNAVTLALSLIATWTVAFVVRFQLPRFLGPERFGSFNFADNFSSGFFTLVDFGIDVYIVKETATRPARASEFFGGVLAVRLVWSVVTIVVMAATLSATHRPTEVVLATIVFGVTQLAILNNNSLAALLQAATRVRRLALANVASKVLWGVGLAIVIFFRGSLSLLVVPLLVSELIKTVWLWPAVRSAVGLTLRVDRRATAAALIASLPYFVNTGAVNIGNRFTASSLEFAAADKREVGWYGASANLAGLAMLLSPILGWVLMPLLARAIQRSEEALFVIVRRAIEGLLVCIVPVTLLISLGADLWVRIAFGGKYSEAAASLRLLSLDFSLVYLAIILTMALIVVGRQWAVTVVSFAAIPIRAALIVPFVWLGTKWLGPGGAAFGASATEIAGIGTTVVGSLFLAGGRALDRRAIVVIAKSVVIAILVAALDHFLSPLGYARLVVDMVAYVVLALVSGAVRVHEVSSIVRLMRSARRGGDPMGSTGLPPPGV
jgi:O-antigen/teichoic acid export membrane protein